MTSVPAGIGMYRPKALLAIALLIGMLGTYAGFLSSLADAPAIAHAQQNTCDGFSDCDFTCSIEDDDWYGSDGVWMIVHAVPTNTTSSSQAIWYDNDPDQYPRLEVTGYWSTNGANPVTVTAKVLVDDDGSCDDLEDPNDWIRCHGGALSVDEYLCDDYGGTWERVPQATGTPATGDECLEQFDLGFDFIKEFTYDTSFYCFRQAKVKAKRPYDLYAVAVCDGSSLSWLNEASVVTWECDDYSEQRPDGSSERLDVTLYYQYR